MDQMDRLADPAGLGVPIDAPRRTPAVTLGFVKSERKAAAVCNAAALFSELRCVSGDVTADRDASTVVSGEEENACSTSGIAEITWWPADITSGAEVTVVAAGELNWVTIEASAEAPA